MKAPTVTQMFHNPEGPVCALPGSLQRMYVTRSGKRYGPYWVRMWREDGRLRREYVTADRVEQVRLGIAKFRYAKRVLARGAAARRQSRRRALFAYLEASCFSSPSLRLRLLERMKRRGKLLGKTPWETP